MLVSSVGSQTNYLCFSSNIPLIDERIKLVYFDFTDDKLQSLYLQVCCESIYLHKSKKFWYLVYSKRAYKESYSTVPAFFLFKYMIHCNW